MVKVVWSRWYGQGGMVKVVWSKWYGKGEGCPRLPILVRILPTDPDSPGSSWLSLTSEWECSVRRILTVRDPPDCPLLVSENTVSGGSRQSGIHLTVPYLWVRIQCPEDPDSPGYSWQSLTSEWEYSVRRIPTVRDPPDCPLLVSENTVSGGSRQSGILLTFPYLWVRIQCPEDPDSPGYSWQSLTSEWEYSVRRIPTVRDPTDCPLLVSENTVSGGSRQSGILLTVPY